MNDTIAAISTAPGAAGIGIVRISGPAAVPVADRVFRAADGTALADAGSHTVRYGHICRDGEILDEVLVSVFLGPRSYTREDVVEISGHGGSLVLARVLEAVLGAGARLAAPGEFTQRAFLSGRIDLSQAEAVMDLIESGNRVAARSALSQLGGALRRRIEDLRGRVLAETARIEAALDDPEHYSLEGFAPELAASLEGILLETKELIRRSEEGRVIREGVSTVILGRPNAGKSTLLNLFAGAERAIVTDIPGTTRDVLEETVTLCGVPLRVSDTAGLREGADAIEKIGVERAKAAAEEADLILYVIDGSQVPSKQDRENLAALAGRPVILILNKGDLRPQTSHEEAGAMLAGAPVVGMSAIDGKGLNTLGELLRERYFSGALSADVEPYITNARHREALQEAEAALVRVLAAISERVPEDLYTVDLAEAYAALSRVIGEEVDEDLIDEIFSRFCLGK